MPGIVVAQYNSGMLETLLPSIIFGVIGMWLLKRAKVKGNFYLLFIAIALMVYPYFTPTALTTWLGGFALCGGAKWVWWWDA